MSLPYFQYYVKDMEAKIHWLSPGEEGCYHRLMRLCWMTPNCTIPDDHTWIKRRIGYSDENFEEYAKPVLEEFFTRNRSGRLYNPRLKEEWDKADAKRTKKKTPSREKTDLQDDAESDIDNKGLKHDPTDKPLKDNKEKPKKTPLRAYGSGSGSKYGNNNINIKDICNQLYEKWNQHAEQHSGVQKVRAGIDSPSREKLVSLRLKECGDNSDLLFEAISNVKNNPHWIGQSSSTWFADFNWVFKSSQNFRKVLEYATDNNNQAGSRGAGSGYQGSQNASRSNTGNNGSKPSGLGGAFISLYGKETQQLDAGMVDITGSSKRADEPLQLGFDEDQRDDG